MRTRGQRASGAERCNGSAALCDRPLGTVAFATTHNSMASEANNFRGPNQARSIPAQLRHGIRGMQLDVYAGTAKGGSVYTDFSGPYGKLGSDLSPALAAAGRAAHRRLGAPPPGTPTEVYMCHGFCELGAIRFSTVARQIERFLDEHPREVLVIVFEDHLSTDRIADALRTGGLAPMLLPVEVGQPLPTLGAMIASGQRAVRDAGERRRRPDAAQRVRRAGRRDAVHLRHAARAPSPGFVRRRTGATTPRRCSSSTTG